MTLNLCMKKCARTSIFLFFALLAGLIIQAKSMAAESNATTGILVVTYDRGFLGNQEIGDGFDQFAVGRNADILYVTDARSQDILNQKLANLAEKGASRIIVLPLFISSADARWQMAKSWLSGYSHQGVDSLLIAKPYGSSYLAVEDLADRLRQAPTDKKKLLLIGGGANDAESIEQAKADLTQMAQFASTAEDIQVVISAGWGAGREQQQQYNDALKNAHDTLVVPVLLANKADSMMSFESGLGRRIPKDAQLVTSNFSTTAGLAQWMEYATNEVLLKSSGANAGNIGAIALAHGSNWFWNESIRNALAPVATKYPLVFTFSMADQPTIERAVRDVEKKGVHGIVLVRIFGEASSFRPTVERMIGADVHSSMPAGHDHSMMGMDMSHGHGGMMMHGDHAMSTLAAAPRIRTSLPIITLGGVEDSPYFAKALLANARSVSIDPSRETIILTAHGAGADADNDHWLGLLGRLAEQMKAEPGYNFKEINYVTWREDWPDKNKGEVAKARKMVEDITKDGGHVLIVPARTNGRGAANRYLKGLNFGWSQGFAQTPYFSQWFEDQVKQGVDQLTGAQPIPQQSMDGMDMSAHHAH